MKLLFISLGCDKNLVDSEYMIGMLTNHGIELTDDETAADIIIVNSCCFIGDAKEESINTILEMAQQKKTGKCRSSHRGCNIPKGTNRREKPRKCRKSPKKRIVGL